MVRSKSGIKGGLSGILERQAQSDNRSEHHAKWYFFEQTMRWWQIALVILCVCGIVGIALSAWSGYQSPPAMSPPAPYDSGQITERKNIFHKLDPQYLQDLSNYQTRNTQATIEVDEKYFKIVDDVLGANATPEELAMLAIWAEKEDPWFESNNHLYHIIWGRSVSRLENTKGIRSEYALWKIR